MAAPATAIPEELLAEIFLRLPDPADLARVSGTCPFFHSLATDRSFLRRYRKIYLPPLLGFIDQRPAFHPAFHPASMPHPSAPAARAVADAADFSFSFLPTPIHSWVVQDVRDGRVLLLDRERNIEEGKRAFTDLAVCDPLYRQYLLLPSVPDDLAASVEDPPTSMRWCEPFFVPPSDKEEEEELAEGTTFRVMWMAQCVTKLAFLDFSSSTRQWRAASSKCWADLYPAAVWSHVLQGERMLWKRNYAYSCFYWVMTDWKEKMLELDIGKMEISITDMPPGGISRSNVIVEAGEGKRGIATIESNFDGYNNHTPDLGYNGQDSSQWHMEKPIPVPSGYYCEIAHYTEKHLVIRMTKDMNQSQDFEYFSFDVKTLHMEKVCDSKEYICRPRRYTNFRPSLLSSPTVCSGMLKGAAEEMLGRGAAS